MSTVLHYNKLTVLHYNFLTGKKKNYGSPDQFREWYSLQSLALNYVPSLSQIWKTGGQFDRPALNSGTVSLLRRSAFLAIRTYNRRTQNMDTLWCTGRFLVVAPMQWWLFPRSREFLGEGLTIYFQPGFLRF